MNKFIVKEKIKKPLVILGIILIVFLIILAWFSGFFSIIFYILGLYTALYFLSVIFKTTKIIETIVGIGGFLLYLWLALWGLWLLYLILKIMFTENFFWGLILLIIGLPLAEMILYGLGIVMGLVLGYPLIFFLKDLEKKFGENEQRNY